MTIAILREINYEDFKWPICGDLELVAILMVVILSIVVSYGYGIAETGKPTLKKSMAVKKIFHSRGKMCCILLW